MRTPPILLPAVLMLMLTGLSVSADTHYVSVNSTNPTPPYTNWVTAANVIQDAVDAATAGDTVLVTNGVYDAGGRGMNRVAVNKALTLVSASGPESTVIRGAKAIGGGNGESAMRCVYLATGASLIGFTLTNGATRTVFDPSTYQSGGGGLWCPTTDAWVSNCILTGNSADDWGGGAVNGTLYRCTLQNNTAGAGGGIVDSILLECRLEGNSAGTGGGAWRGTLVDCALVGNTANAGGGAAYGALARCLIAGNSATGGGGVIGASLHECTLVGNSASSSGGGASGGTLKRCLIIGNSAYTGGGVSSVRNIQYLENCVLLGNKAEFEGGAAVGSRLAQCTVVGNSAGIGGGVSASSLTNSIVFFNSASEAGANYWMSHLLFCCATPLPTNGVGNIANAPQFVDAAASNFHLLATSRCIDAGTNQTWMVGAVDLDGNPRIFNGIVDMGAYEYVPAVEAGMLFVPRVLNQKSRGQYVMAILCMPEGVLVSDLDADEPWRLMPGDIEAACVRTISHKRWQIVYAIFERDELLDAIQLPQQEVTGGRGRGHSRRTRSTEVEIVVYSKLATGQTILGADKIRVIQNPPRRHRLPDHSIGYRRAKHSTE